MDMLEKNGHPALPTVDKEGAERKSRWKGHVLVVPYPAQGHVNPMMHLSHLLAAQGVLVTFVNTQFNHDRILRARALSPAQPQSNPDDYIRLVSVQDGLGHDEYVANYSVHKHAQAISKSGPMLVKLVEVAQPPITCIIADVFFISTPTVARHFNIPHVAFWTQTVASYASHLFVTQNHVSLKEYFEGLRVEGKEDERVITCMPTCPPMSLKEVPTFLQPCDPSDFVFSCLIEIYQNIAHNTLVLMNSFEDLEEKSLAYIQAPNTRCIGPLLPRDFVLGHEDATNFDKGQKVATTLGTSFWMEDYEGCLPWLHRQKACSVLYVSFGSITLTSTQQIEEFVGGLEASGYPFLMVVRPEMMEGGVALPYGFVQKMQGTGRSAFVAWAPQLDVLAHPAIGGFLTHAGWNSTLESICRGVPLLCWPYFSDQMLNTRCIVDAWKIGLEFSKANGFPTEEEGCKEVGLVMCAEIEKKIRLLMDPLTSIELRNRVKTFSLAAKRSFESSSRSNLESLLDVIFN